MSFAPTDIAGLRLWLDADDATTIEASSGAVSAWTSKDANAREFTQATSALQPATGATTLASRNVVDFAGDYLTSTAAASTWAFLHNSNKHSVFMVVKAGTVASPDAVYAIYGTHATDGANIGDGFYYDDRSSVSRSDALVLYTLNGVSGGSGIVLVIVANDAWSPNTPTRVEAHYDLGNATANNRVSARIDGGTAITGNTYTNSPTASDPTYTLQIGATGAGGDVLTGYIAELLLYEAELTSAERDDVYGYLSDKWFPVAVDAPGASAGSVSALGAAEYVATPEGVDFVPAEWTMDAGEPTFDSTATDFSVDRTLITSAMASSEVGASAVVQDATGASAATATEVTAASAALQASASAEATASEVGASVSTVPALGTVAASTTQDATASAVFSAAGAGEANTSESYDSADIITATGASAAAASEAAGAAPVTAAGAGASATDASESGSAVVSFAAAGDALAEASGSSAATAVFVAPGSALAEAAEAHDGAEVFDATGASSATASETLSDPAVVASASAAASVDASEVGAGIVTFGAAGADAATASDTASAGAEVNPVATAVASASVEGAGVVSFGPSSDEVVHTTSSAAGELLASASGSVNATASESGEGERLIAFVMTPSALVSATGIVDQDGLTVDLHEAIDESMSSPDDDATYLVNSASASGSAWVTLAEVPAGLEAVTRYGVRVRARREA